MKVAEMTNGKWAYVAADAMPGDSIEIWCVRTGHKWVGVVAKIVIE